ncbi:L-glutamate gamma-semialdehyde dehydrogenase [Cohnella fermenti]|uniref:L-glutamate gamma-semialdehyde dehydrogenase n=1 Tax=Cohnella fermenti TaxID=2565925 RepID=A0A4S4C4G4_9BACL|nr:L-glutamate gamma-semialdehyde dehydrogenase [Cohnella fermenti]THF82676.1 L-glutamate gamma-semialdehyde dehydrogenase [Cohnella fermenti]
MQVNLSAIGAFVNEKLTDFGNETNANEMRSAIKLIKSRQGEKYPLHIGDEVIYTDDMTVSVDPANPTQVVGYVSKASRDLAEKAMEASLLAFEKWKRTPVEERAVCLFKAASLIRDKKHEYSAWMILESGKNWTEADADTAEAIDFLEYYGREMLRLNRTNETNPLTRLTGEVNWLDYIPLGVGIVIPPWNFPLAICAGMTSAAVVAGNSVVLKPASTTPIIAYRFYETMIEAGIPPGVIQYLPGSGAEIGDYLTSHPKTRFISFTGSKEVGLRINRLAAETAEGQIWIKRVIAEMGGKDGTVVDETADLDMAAEAIVSAAFGFQGQKCSAGSRAIIVESVYDEMLAKIAELTAKLSLGQPTENKAIGPVIDESSYERILSYIERGKGKNRLLFGGGKGAGEGYFIEPTAFADVNPDSELMQEEIFGPVLAIAKATDWKEAIRIYNDTEFGLTGSYFSHDEDRIEAALRDMHCGNLYVNRKCTGALVGVHPFGGFNMSGTDSKAGGHDYLLLFTQAKLMSRKED